MPPSLPSVADVMRPAPLLVPGDRPASEVAGQIHAMNQRHVFVADAEGRLVGLVNRARLLRHLVARRLADNLTPDVPIADLLVTDLVTVTPEQGVIEALRQMWTHHVGSLPVLDADGHLVGLVTERLLLGCAEEVITAPERTGGRPA